MLDSDSPGNRLPKETHFPYPWPFPQKPSWFYRIKSDLTIMTVYSLSKFVCCVLNRIKISPEHKRILLELIEDKKRPLITVSNHRCVVDDPLIWSVFSFSEFWRNISRFRYTLAAHDICFTTALHTKFFSLGRCIPCVRGTGVFQQGVDHCIDMLNENGWVHIFPEGKVTQDRIRIKWGVGRMIAEPRVPPILLPIWTHGMQNIWSERKAIWPHYFPRIGKTVEIFVGTPMDTALWLAHSPATKENEEERRKRLADRVQAELFGLGDRVDEEMASRRR